MKIIFGKQTKPAKADTPRAQVVLALNFDNVEKFQGFSYTVAEGQEMAKRSHTEIAEFHPREIEE